MFVAHVAPCGFRSDVGAGVLPCGLRRIFGTLRVASSLVLHGPCVLLCVCVKMSMPFVKCAVGR
jgi:hypothetical protein